MDYNNLNLVHYIKKAEEKSSKEVLTRDIIQNFKKQHIPEGLYLSERNVFNNAFDDARHIFITNIYNKKPKYIDARPLDNGQYATTLSMNSQMIFGLPLGGNYLAVNGRSGNKVFDTTDLQCINDLVTKTKNNNRDMKPSLYPITNDKRRRYSLARKLKNIMEENKEKYLGDYHLFGFPGIVQKNNCISIAAALMSRAGIKPEDLPEHLGGIGGIRNTEISDYENLIPEKETTKKAGVLDTYTITATPKTQKKKKKPTQNFINWFSSKSPEQKLKEEFEQSIVENNPKLWNELNEKDEYPKKDSRGNLISALGTGAGLAYGLGRGYFKSKKDPEYGTPQIIASGLGFGALGFGLATTKDLIARGAGHVAGNIVEPRTPEEQAEYDSKKQIYSKIPGFDTYNAQLRKRLKQKQQQESEQDNTNKD